MKLRALSLVFCVLLGPSLAAADTDESGPSGDILWLVDGAGDGDEGDVLAGVEQALSAEGDRHLLGEDDLEQRLESASPPPLSACARGVEPCPPAQTMALDALGVALVIELALVREGDTLKINYEMVDRRGEIAAQGSLEAATGRQAGFEMVGELFDAVGVVSFESEPSGAAVIVDGEPLGTTPVSRQFPVGQAEYRLEMPGYEPREGIVEIGSGGAHQVAHKLSPTVGHLRVSGAPDEATVSVDGQEVGRAREIVEMSPGERAIEVEAEGFQTYRTTLVIGAGQVEDLAVSMRPLPGILRQMEASELAAYRYRLDVGFEGAGQASRFQGAGGSVGDEAIRFDGWRDQGAIVDGAQALIMRGGLTLSMAYEGPQWGLGLLGLSLTTHAGNRPVQVGFVAANEIYEADLRSVQTLTVRPMQVRFRTFYENLAPYGQAGLGLAVHWLGLESPEYGTIRMRQVDALASFEVGTRYHFDARWSLGGAYRLDANFSAGQGLNHSLGVSVGFGLRELPGMDPQPPEQL